MEGVSSVDLVDDDELVGGAGYEGSKSCSERMLGRMRES